MRKWLTNWTYRDFKSEPCLQCLREWMVRLDLYLRSLSRISSRPSCCTWYLWVLLHLCLHVHGLLEEQRKERRWSSRNRIRRSWDGKTYSNGTKSTATRYAHATTTNYDAASNAVANDGRRDDDATRNGWSNARSRDDDATTHDDGWNAIISPLEFYHNHHYDQQLVDDVPNVTSKSNLKMLRHQKLSKRLESISMNIISDDDCLSLLWF